MTLHSDSRDRMGNGSAKKAITASILMGVGLGGFVDGIADDFTVHLAQGARAEIEFNWQYAGRESRK